MLRIEAAQERKCEQENNAPQGYENNQDIVCNAKALLPYKDAAVEEEYTELNCGVRELFNQKSCIIEFLFVLHPPLDSLFVITPKLSYRSSSDLICSLSPDKNARKENQPVINTDEGGLQSKAHVKPKANRQRANKGKEDGCHDKTSYSVHF